MYICIYIYVCICLYEQVAESTAAKAATSKTKRAKV